MYWIRPPPRTCNATPGFTQGAERQVKANPQHDTHRRPGCDPVCSEQARCICTSTIVSRVLDTKPLLLPIRRSDPARSLLTWLNFDRFHAPCLLESTVTALSDLADTSLSSLWAVTHVGPLEHLIDDPHVRNDGISLTPANRLVRPSGGLDGTTVPC